ncbi:MAG: GNAT family N-acetyltransferase [Bacteroidetes bacterium]|nr:MAG: GNAT family N-acetyltransferase [Bacteroidota bacterium]
MIVVREATLDDAEMISNFQVAMAMETESFVLNKTTVSKGVKAVFEDEGKGKYFVAEKDSVVAGSLMITCEWSDWRNKAVWWIQSVYIMPEYRGQRIFSKMYEKIRIIVESNTQVAGIRLYVDLANNNAREVYKALGMNGEHYQLFEWMKEG